MNPEQFAAFVTAEQQDRAAARDAAEEQHQQWKVTAARRAFRQKAESQAKRVPACDGVTTKAVREWLREIGFTIPYSVETVYITARTAEEPLQREIER